jgi:hypothetical protein
MASGWPDECVKKITQYVSQPIFLYTGISVTVPRFLLQGAAMRVLGNICSHHLPTLSQEHLSLSLDPTLLTYAYLDPKYLGQKMGRSGTPDVGGMRLGDRVDQLATYTWNTWLFNPLFVKMRKVWCGKRGPNFLATFAIFKKLPEENCHANGRKFAPNQVTLNCTQILCSAFWNETSAYNSFLGLYMWSLQAGWPEAGSEKMELRCSSKFERSLGRSVIENALKSCANKLP